MSKIHTKTEKQYVGYVYSTQAMLSLISFPNPPLYKQGYWRSVLIAYCDSTEIKINRFLASAHFKSGGPSAVSDVFLWS